MSFPVSPRRVSLALATLALGACTSLKPVPAPLVNYQPEAFDASSFARHFSAAPARTCEAARRALLSQGYLVTSNAAEQVTARKYFQPDAEHHVQLEFRVVCTPESLGPDTSTAFVSGLKDQYLVRKVKESASLGVGGLGSLSLPIEGALDSMVKVSSETVADADLYERFFDLIGDWLAKHKKKKTRTWSVTQPIIAGERLWTLTCASDISDGARFVKATRKEANTQIRKFKLGTGTNNTGIHSQGSALAAFCYLGDPAKRDIAANNLNRLADYLVLSDGSDREGSPWYAYYTLRLLENLAPIYTRCGVSYDRIWAATERLQHYLAATVDPNFHLVMIGDTHRAKLGPKWFAPDSEARWAATQGAEGQPPTSLYDVFAGGYVFARNSWTDIDGHRPTFYSVRVSRPYVTAHVHSDLGSVTFNSYGTEFVGDPGPYRYNSSAIRDYMVSRSGHSVIRVTEKKPKKKKKKSSALAFSSAPRSSAVLATNGDPYNRTCLKDGTYSAARIKRCVYYDTAIDGLVVVDTIKARKRIRADQRWQVPNGVSVSKRPRGATMTSPNAAATMLFTGGGKVRKYRPSSKRQDGWFTNGYGELVKGTTLQRGATIAKGKKRTWVSVLAAGESAPSVSLTDGVVSVTREQTATFPLP